MKKLLLLLVLLFLALPASAIRMKKTPCGCPTVAVAGASYLKKGTCFFTTAGSCAQLVWRKTFNSTAPFGNDEDADSTSDCTTRGANISEVSHRCEQGGGGGVAGKAEYLLYFGGGVAATAWDSDFTGLADAWIRVHIKINEIANSTSQIILFRSGAGNIGAGYSFGYGAPATDTLVVTCDGNSANWAGGYTHGVWAEYQIHINIVEGDVKIWKNDFTGVADVTCLGAGDDAGMPFDGLRVITLDGHLLMGMDDIRIYDGDPR